MTAVCNVWVVKANVNVVAGGFLFAVNRKPYHREREPVKGFVMNFSTGEIIDTIIPLRKVEYCTECLVHIIFKYMRMLVKSYIPNFHKTITGN